MRRGLFQFLVVTIRISSTFPLDFRYISAKCLHKCSTRRKILIALISNEEQDPTLLIIYIPTTTYKVYFIKRTSPPSLTTTVANYCSKIFATIYLIHTNLVLFLILRVHNRDLVYVVQLLHTGTSTIVQWGGETMAKNNSNRTQRERDRCNNGQHNLFYDSSKI